MAIRYRLTLTDEHGHKAYHEGPDVRELQGIALSYLNGFPIIRLPPAADPPPTPVEPPKAPAVPRTAPGPPPAKPVAIPLICTYHKAPMTQEGAMGRPYHYAPGGHPCFGAR